jgi:hypothetical protein
MTLAFDRWGGRLERIPKKLIGFFDKNSLQLLDSGAISYRSHGSMRGTSALAVMTSHKHVLGLVDTRGEIRRPAVVWMQLLHKLAMRPSYFARRRPFFEAQYLIGLVLRNRRRAAARASAGAAPPRVSLTLSCTTPSGKAAVEICL